MMTEYDQLRLSLPEYNLLASCIVHLTGDFDMTELAEPSVAMWFLEPSSKREHLHALGAASSLSRRT